MKRLPVESNKVYVIAGLHLILILYGLFLTIEDIINQQNPFTLYEFIYVICYYTGHFMLVVLLLAGTKKKISSLYLPWLAVLLAIFTTATYDWLESVMRGGILYVVPFLINILVLGLGWFSWYTVLKNCKRVYQKQYISISTY